jgi:hypothetical protein
MTRDRSFRMRTLSLVANILGIQFKVEGLPYGASYKRAYPRGKALYELNTGDASR